MAKRVIFGTRVGWLVVLRINVVQPYLDLEAGDNQSLKIQVARPGIRHKGLGVRTPFSPLSLQRLEVQQSPKKLFLA